MAKKNAQQKEVQCYLCLNLIHVPMRTMSLPCPTCHQSIQVEDLVFSKYTAVTDIRTCGKIKVTKKGRVAVREIESGDGIVCEGSIEGTIKTNGPIRFGPKAFWKGTTLTSSSLAIAKGAKLEGIVRVPKIVNYDEEE